MTNYRKILRLKKPRPDAYEHRGSLWLREERRSQGPQPGEGTGNHLGFCAGPYVRRTSRKALSRGGRKALVQEPDYEKIYREMQKPGVTLTLLWVKYCEECHAAGEPLYQSTAVQQVLRGLRPQDEGHMHLGEMMRVCAGYASLLS